MIRFHNTLTRKLDAFEPLQAGRVGLYTCGPTVYSHAHIGNFRTFVWEDLLRRFLERRGFKVRQVMNITDVDDKIIAAAAAQHRSLNEITSAYEQAFFRDLETLGIGRADVYPRATEHIPDMVALIEALAAKGMTYDRNGSIYYRIGRFPGYGRLSGKKISQLVAGASGRVDADEYGKDDVRDFALWKAARQGEPSWKGPCGPGRPGWHIECSTMSMKYLGESFDIHTGGVDNIFPHHENEIAQSEGATGQPLARYWLHAAHLVVDGEKMSKSRGNFYTLRDLLERGEESRTLRYFLLSVHYRRVLDLKRDALQWARKSLQRLDDFVARLGTDPLASESKTRITPALAGASSRFHESLDDDLNTARALGALFEAVREMNAAMDKGWAGPRDAAICRALAADFETIFGIKLGRAAGDLPEEVGMLIKTREEARRQRNFSEADRIRKQLLALGVAIEDTPGGTRWRRIRGR
ncbi:MAG: cysteine--tRNA ligase [Acidobacteriota bacterium]